jgi:hypothetical protein
VTPVDNAPSRWTRGGLVRAATIAGVALGTGATLGYLVSHEPMPRGSGSPSTVSDTIPSDAPASDAELAILSPLREGGALGEFEITRIEPIGEDGLLQITCRRGGAAVRLEVALAVDGGPLPPAVAGRYAVFYALEKAAPADGQRLALALAAILEANTAAPIPPGLGPFGSKQP